tara:strand:+ start:110 stop:610 length:501 start_codon:yes stop_codon:yes gene_type:complete
MKYLVYGVLVLIFAVVIIQLNSLFSVNDKLDKSAKRQEKEKYKDQNKLLENAERIKQGIGLGTNDLKNSIETKLKDAEREKIIKFSKKYFGQVGRNYRVFYLKDDKMVYLQRMWFDQVRTASQVIKSEFPSIFESEGCCFTAEPEFFMVVPGTSIYKQTGPYRFDR